MPKWAQNQLEKAMHAYSPTIQIDRRDSANPRLVILDLTGGTRKGSLVFIGVGLPHDTTMCGKHGIERFALDDYLLRLVCDPAAFAANSDLNVVSCEVAMHKLEEMTALLRHNGIAILHAKRILYMLRVIANFR